MKEFIENMLTYERDLFFFLIGSDSVFLDDVMWVISKSGVWVLFYVFVAIFLFYETPVKEAALVLLLFVLTMAFCDLFSSGLIKPIFERLRPTHHPDFRDLVDIVHGHRGGGFSFISGHATNSFGFAVFLSLIFRNRWVTLAALTWATLISYSRIYLGMHFVSDVVGGMVAGILIAFLMYVVLIFLRKKFFQLESSTQTRIYSKQQGKVLALVLTVYALGVVVYGQL